MIVKYIYYFNQGNAKHRIKGCGNTYEVQREM